MITLRPGSVISAAVAGLLLWGCGPGDIISTKGVERVLKGQASLTGDPACQSRIMVRPQPDGPDDNFRPFLAAASTIVGAKTAWDPAREARFERLLAEADMLRPNSAEVKALRAEFRQTLTVWRIRKGRVEARRGVSFPAQFVNSVGITMKLIQGDTFMMGDGDGDRDESPVHTVKITHPFYIGVYEVTAEQYGRVMNAAGGPEPKSLVSWHDATEFCRRLSFKEGVTYTLPTEAQWEFACRARTQTPYSFGGTWNEAGSRKPNSWGLYDMHGNVPEWCRNWYGPYPGGTHADPTGPRTGKVRVVRGGGMTDSAWVCRVSSRDGFRPDSRANQVGFRVVVSLSPEGD